MKTTTQFLEELVGADWQAFTNTLIQEGVVDSFTITGSEVEIILSRQAELDQLFDLFSGFTDEEADLRKTKYDI